MRVEERSLGALLLAMVTLGLLAVAFLAPWFQYDLETARHVAPDGPYPPEVTGVERQRLTFTSQGWAGDVEPSDGAAAELAIQWMSVGVLATAALVAVALLGEIPGVASILKRRAALAILTVALVALAAVAIATWVLLPESVAGYGVDSQYTANLEEDSYTHTTMMVGWYAAALAWAPLFGTFLFKFQAGVASPSMVEAHQA